MLNFNWLSIVILECPALEPPCNGRLLDVPSNPKPGDVATFDCLDGFELDGDKNGTRICLEDYTWDGMSLCCVKHADVCIYYILTGFKNATLGQQR